MARSRQSGAPTIRDVARLAGVSAQSVSRVLNSPERVSPATRARIDRAIEQLDYRRSPMALGLATNRSGAIGVIDSGSDVLGQMMIVSRVQSAARAHGYSARVVVPDSETRTGLQGALEALRNERIEGLIVLANTTLHARAVEWASSRVPVVMIASAEELADGVSVVGVDQKGGARAVLRHLAMHGDRIGHIAGPSGWVDADARFDVWLQQAPQLDRSLVRRGDWSAASGYAAMEELLDVGVDAVMASNDLMALGAIRACHARRIRVPEDVAISGFDDIAGADFAVPALTTVRQPFAELGTQAVEVLSQMMGGGGPTNLMLPTELVVRESA